jgi:hypothetical protein
VAVCILLRGVVTLWLGVLAARLFLRHFQNHFTMKTCILFSVLLSVFTVTLYGQTTILSTNLIVFERLFSCTNTILMTNAEFRCVLGDRLFFRNNNAYQGFHAYDLNNNVLTRLHLTKDQLNLQQVRLDDQKFKSLTVDQEKNSATSESQTDTDDFDNRIKNELEESTYVGETSDSIINGINSAFSELIERAELSDAYQWQINKVVDKLETERDEEKLKVLGMAREIAWRRLQDAKLAEQIAKQNLSNFESNPMAYLTNQTVPISLTNSTP